MKKYDSLIQKINFIINMGWIKSKGNGYGACGYTLEKLLNISTNNFEIPDYHGVELKTKVSKKNANISLLGAAPDSYLFIVKDMLDKYGYISNKNHGLKVFYSSFTTQQRTYLKYNTYGIIRIFSEETPSNTRDCLTVFVGTKIQSANKCSS